MAVILLSGQRSDHGVDARCLMAVMAGPSQEPIFAGPLPVSLYSCLWRGGSLSASIVLPLVSTQRGSAWIVLLPYGSGSTRLKEGEERLGIHSPQTQLCAEASKTAPPCHSGSFSLFFCFFFGGGEGGGEAPCCIRNGSSPTRGW